MMIINWVALLFLLYMWGHWGLREDLNELAFEQGPTQLQSLPSYTLGWLLQNKLIKRHEATYMII